jgi:hypothetical protein
MKGTTVKGKESSGGAGTSVALPPTKNEMKGATSAGSTSQQQSPKKEAMPVNEDPPNAETEHVSQPSSDSHVSVESSQERSESESDSESERRAYLVRRGVTMASFGAKIPPIDLEADDLAEQFKLFRYRHENLMTILKIDAADKQGRAASFRMELPEEAQVILMEFDWENSTKDKDSIDDIVSVVCQAKAKKASRLVARHKFLTRFMKKGERFTDFKRAVTAMAEQCGYSKEVKETLIRDIIISRHNDEPLQKSLLFDLDDDVTLDKVIQICERHEHSLEAAKEMRPGTSHSVNANSSKDRKEKEKKKEKKEKKEKNTGPGPANNDKEKLWRCDRFCGGHHIRGHQHCKAFGKTCTKCGKMNHFEEVCINPPQPGWKARSKASEENHRKVRAERGFAVNDDSSDGESQRASPQPKKNEGYVTDVDPVQSDSDSDKEPESPPMFRPARKVNVIKEQLKITTRADSDLRNALEKKEEKKTRYGETETISIIREDGKKKIILPRSFPNRYSTSRHSERGRRDRSKERREDERHPRRGRSPRRERREIRPPSRS